MRPRLERPMVVMPVERGENSALIIGRFMKEARRQGWNHEEISEVIEEVTSGDYESLIEVFSQVTASKQ